MLIMMPHFRVNTMPFFIITVRFEFYAGPRLTFPKTPTQTATDAIYSGQNLKVTIKTNSHDAEPGG